MIRNDRECIRNHQKPDFTEGELSMEIPFEDIDSLDPKWEKWAERKFQDPGWRNEAKMVFKGLIEATKNFNTAFKGTARPREIEPHWESILLKIDGIEKEMASHGFVRDFGVYTYQSDWSDDETEVNVIDNGRNSLNVAMNQDTSNQTDGTGKNRNRFICEPGLIMIQQESIIQVLKKVVMNPEVNKIQNRKKVYLKWSFPQMTKSLDLTTQMHREMEF